MKKICVLLRGGLGNQLIQYMYGCDVSQKFGLEISFEDQVGFKNDKVYRRSSEIADLINKRCNYKIITDSSIYFWGAKIADNGNDEVKKNIFAVPTILKKQNA